MLRKIKMSSLSSYLLIVPFHLMTAAIRRGNEAYSSCDFAYNNAF